VGVYPEARKIRDIFSGFFLMRNRLNDTGISFQIGTHPTQLLATHLAAMNSEWYTPPTYVDLRPPSFSEFL